MNTLIAASTALSLATAPIVTPPEHCRPPDQTFLTGPEWFLVFSPAEYADYIQHRPPSGFPFFGHIRQFWQGYYQVSMASTQYPTNYGYHMMDLVIGASTTAEYGLKAVYEATLGRFSENLAGVPDTAEDRLSADVAQRYVDFIKVHPWFEFDFLTPLQSVWTETGLWGDKPFRKWERKYFLTSEYLAKALYGWILEKASHASYDTPIERTDVIVDGTLPAAGKWPEGVELAQQDADSALISAPRYQAFTDIAETLAGAGMGFREIAGNRGDILVTILSADGFQPDSAGRLIYRQPILTKPGTWRFALVYQIGDLAPALRRFAGQGIEVEHVYDY
jgi:hypothetical protein